MGLNTLFEITHELDPEKEYNCLIVMYYDFDDNIFYDENGYPIFDLFEYITPNELYLFKKTREDYFALRPNGDYVEMIYPEYVVF